VRENPAESAALLARHKRLVGVHVNDSYGMGDDDIMVGSVHIWTMLEFLMVLEEVGYDGWLTLDMVPRKETPVAAATVSLAVLQSFMRILERLDRAALKQAQGELDAIKTQQIVQAMLA